MRTKQVTSFTVVAFMAQTQFSFSIFLTPGFFSFGSVR